MTENKNLTDIGTMELTADIVAAYVSHNSLAMDALPALIHSVDQCLKRLGQPAAPKQELELVPAVPIKKSVSPDFIICLEDGKAFKSLKRHLKAAYDMTPEDYRTKWRLAPDYPMVAPNYAAARSALAKSSGLGQARRKAAKPVAPARAAKAPANPPAKGRKAKS
jgi:predicted transcriptional regulator